MTKPKLSIVAYVPPETESKVIATMFSITDLLQKLSSTKDGLGVLPFEVSVLVEVDEEPGVPSDLSHSGGV